MKQARDCSTARIHGTGPLARTLGTLIAAVAFSTACSGDETPIPPQGSGGTEASGGISGQGGSSPNGGAGGAAATNAGGSSGGLGGASTGGATSGTGGAGGSTSGTGGATSGTGGAGGSTSGAGGVTAGGGSGGASGAAGSAGANAGGLGGAGGGSGGRGGSSGSSGAGGAGVAGAGGSGTTRPARVLLYSFSTLNIPSVPAQLTILENKLESWNFEVDRSTDPAVFSDTNLARYAAVGMINTCFFPFGASNTTGEPQSSALQRFLQQGGGLFGTHCADVTFQSATTPVLYNRLLGGRASSENFEGTSQCRKMGDHPTIAELPATFAYSGNLDNTNYLGTDTTVLVKCRWGNAAQTDVAVSWVRTEGTGRVFFTNFAKVDADLTNATIGDDHIVSGLAWVLGRPLPL